VSSNYTRYQSAFSGKKYPLAFVDMNLLDENIREIMLRSGDTPIRIASKSVRSRHILEYILSANDQFKGLMSFSGTEAVFLSTHGFDDILVAYPETNTDVITAICQEIQNGKYIMLMADHPEHILSLNDIGRKTGTKIPICLDIDMSVDFPGLHFGVWRSSLRNNTGLRELLELIKPLEFIRLEGVMGYEAQIAGVTDQVNNQWLMNRIIRLLKNISVPKIASRRQAAVEMIMAMGFDLKIVNGGGTGSLESTTKEKVVTEVTVGSGFYNSHLFDNYQNFRHQPAAGFACAINRHPDKDIYTCSGGGYVASGAIEPLKLPIPYLPEGASLLKNEGAGEVQTPVLYQGHEKLKIGDPIFFRHSKAGELCERFNDLHLIRNGEIERIVPTYRGEGMCFL
jgi:D-serine deaminase-like pyridoxal phosphate-dependent protein